MPQRTKLKVSSADELRDALPESGVFEMFDCIVEIESPLDSDTSEIGRMVKVLEAAINVVDVIITTTDAILDPNDYTIGITEVTVGFSGKK